MKTDKIFWVLILLAVFLEIGLRKIPSFGSEGKTITENTSTKDSQFQTLRGAFQNAHSSSRTRIKYVRNSKFDNGDNGRFNRTRGSATRNEGNSRIIERYFQILSPSDFSVTTISTHPGFFVYFDRPSNYRTIVSLEENQGKTNKVVWQQEIEVKSAGFKRITIPGNEKGLEYGKDYRFSVLMVRDPQYRSHDIVAQVWLERAELPPQLKDEMDSIVDPVSKATVLAENGIWIDAIDLLKQGNSQLTADLLAQVGLEEIAEKIN